MFARTKRLTLRPGWPEDAPALAAAIAHRAVTTMLAYVPWPYTPRDAEAFLARAVPLDQPSCLIFAHAGRTPLLVGGIGIDRAESGEYEFGYWITPGQWGKGYATEAGRAVTAIARDTLRLDRLHAGHFVDNPASARVLAKLGFRPTRTGMRHSVGRGGEAAFVHAELTLAGEGSTDDPMPIAA